MILAITFSLVIIIIFIILIIYGINYLLKKSLDHFITNHKENFQNSNSDTSIVNPIDECRKIDNESNEQLNFQTATNIPLSPYQYSDYVGKIYSNDMYIEESDELKKGKYCMRKPKLLYDGIWDPKINVNREEGTEFQEWKLTNGNISNDYYCSNKMIETNKPIPPGFIDKSAVYVAPCEESKYYNYLIDPYQDPLDAQLHCFPQVFNAGMNKETIDLVHLETR